jgi:antitoxin component YwqK of YwqJK toxin-antitoxin module
MGRQHGLWKRLIESGDEDFFWGKLDKRFLSPFLSQASFVDGQLDGCWSISSQDGKKIFEWRFENSRCSGSATVWFSDGAKQWEVKYQDGRPVDAYREWNTQGELIDSVPLIDGCSLAQRVGRHRNGHKSYEGTVLVPSKWSRLVFDWWNTKVAVDRTAEIAPERRHGLWTEWYADGTKKYEGEYREGVPHGKFVVWYENGKKQVEGTYKDGEKSGIWSTWTKDGTKDSVAEYVAGLQFWVRTR